MRALRLLLAGALGALSWVVLVAPPSYACSCAVTGTAELVDHASVVVTGTITDKQPPPRRPVMSSTDPVTYTVAVDRAYKGDTADRIEVLSAVSGASCGLEGVRVGQRYLVFADHGRGGDLWASLCGGTAPWSADLEADVVAAAGPGTAVPPSVAPAGGGEPAVDPGPVAAELEAAEGGFLAVPVALAAGAALVLLTLVLWLRLLLRR